MPDVAIEKPTAKTPWHLWIIGLLSLLWNASGAATIIAAQTGQYPGLPADEAAYYAAQAPWFVALTDIALLSAFTGAIMLLLRRRWAVPLYIVSLVCIAVTAGYDLAEGTSRMFANAGALVATIAIWILAALQLWYAAAMHGRGVLR